MATCVPVRPWPWDDCWKLQTATQASPTRRKVCVKAGMPLDSCLTLPIALCRCINSVCDHTEECCHAAVLSIRSWRVPQQAFPAPPSRASPQDQVISTPSVSLHGQSKPVGMVTLVHTLFVWLFLLLAQTHIRTPWLSRWPVVLWYEGGLKGFYTGWELNSIYPQLSYFLRFLHSDVNMWKDRISCSLWMFLPGDATIKYVAVVNSEGDKSVDDLFFDLQRKGMILFNCLSWTKQDLMTPVYTC